MSEDGDFTPSTGWNYSSFDEAKRAYRQTNVARGASRADDRGYGRKQSDGTVKKPYPKELVSSCDAPLIIVIDVTGSMGEWPTTIFSKLPYLDHECRTQYLGEGYGVCFVATGDANKHDSYPLQVQEFVQKQGMQEALDHLIIEKGGGGGGEETYEVTALWLARQLRPAPNSARPIIVFIGDEAPYGSVTKAGAKRFGVVIDKAMRTEEIFEELRQKASVWMVRKPYGWAQDDQEIRAKWVELLGEERIANLADPARVMDVIFGILAEEADKRDYFIDELKERQMKDSDGPDKIRKTMQAMSTIHGAGKSVMRGGTKRGGKKSKPLLP